MGRVYLHEYYDVQTKTIEDVQVGKEDEAMKQLINEGYKLIFVCSFDFVKVYDVAKEYPDVKFVYLTGLETRPNVATCDIRIYQATYLAGMLSGLYLKTLEKTSNAVGYVAAFQIPTVVQGINAFYIGLQSVNPNATGIS